MISQGKSQAHFATPPGAVTAGNAAVRFALWLTAILAVAGAAYIDLAAEDPIFQRAEDYFAESAREMSLMAQHITPILYGKPFFDKPIWSYWAIQASFAIFGPTHFAARVPSILAALATIALVAYALARVWTPRAGLMAAAVLATSYTFFYYATMAMSDIWLTLFCTAAAVLFFAGSEDPARRTLDWCAAAAFCGLAVLTKGPVGAVLPAAAAVLYLAIRRDLRQIRAGQIFGALLIFAAIAVPWYVLLWREQGTAALRAFFLVENIQRFMGESYAQARRPFWFIPVSFVVDFLPWTIFLPAALAHAVRNWRGDWNSRKSRVEFFLWCYVATVVGFFWVARVQMDYYVLPALPACAALTGIYLDHAIAEDARFLRIVNWTAAIGWCVAGVALFGAMMAANGLWLTPAGYSRVPAGLQVFWPLALWMAVAGAAAAILTQQRKYLALMGLTLVGFCGGAAIAVHEAIPFYLRAFPIPTLAAQTEQVAGPAALSKDLEHWRGELSFETGHVLVLASTPEQMSGFLEAPGPHLAIVTDAWGAKLGPEMTEQGRVIYKMPLLRQGITLVDLFDPKVVAETTDGISIIYFPRAAAAD